MMGNKNVSYIVRNMKDLLKLKDTREPIFGLPSWDSPLISIGETGEVGKIIGTDIPYNYQEVMKMKFQIETKEDKIKTYSANLQEIIYIGENVDFEGKPYN